MEILRSEGWFIDEFKLSEVLGESFDKNINKNDLKQIIFDLDVKEYGSSVLWDKISNGKILQGPIVLQLNKWFNVSYPKISEKLDNNGVHCSLLTDGNKPIKCMAIEPIPKLDGRTPYGSKVLLSGQINIESGILQLTCNNTTVLGGNVEKQIEKWKSEKLGNKENRSLTAALAPKWVPFGKKSVENFTGNDYFKSLKTENTDKTEDTEFDAARRTEIENLKAVKNTINLPSANVEIKEKPKLDRHYVKHESKVEYEKSNGTPYNSDRGNRNRGRGRGGHRGNYGKKNDDTSDYSRPKTSNLFDNVILPNLTSDATNEITNKFNQMNVNQNNDYSRNNQTNQNYSSDRTSRGGRGNHYSSNKRGSHHYRGNDSNNRGHNPSSRGRVFYSRGRGQRPNN